jgi:hypothetical protein
MILNCGLESIKLRYKINQAQSLKMKESNIYIHLWQKYRPVIINMMKLATEKPQIYQLSKHEFEAIGDRTSSGYSFNLEIINGILANNIDGTAVARDLFEVLKSSKTANSIMQENYIKINLTSDFKLKIQIQTAP